MTVDCIVELIENLKLSSSASFDNINLKILKNTKLISFELLRMIFQHTLFKGSLPRDWKIAKIIPIHKRGDQRHISNCRSIELVFHQRFSTVYFLHTLQIPQMLIISLITSTASVKGLQATLKQLNSQMNFTQQWIKVITLMPSSLIFQKHQIVFPIIAFQLNFHHSTWVCRPQPGLATSSHLVIIICVLRCYSRSWHFHIRQLACEMYVRPKPEYAGAIQSPNQAYLIRLMGSVQNRAVQFITSSCCPFSRITAIETSLGFFS